MALSGSKGISIYLFFGLRIYNDAPVTSLIRAFMGKDAHISKIFDVLFNCTFDTPILFAMFSAVIDESEMTRSIIF